MKLFEFTDSGRNPARKTAMAMEMESMLWTGTTTTKNRTKTSSIKSEMEEIHTAEVIIPAVVSTIGAALSVEEEEARIEVVEEDLADPLLVKATTLAIKTRTTPAPPTRTIKAIKGRNVSIARKKDTDKRPVILASMPTNHVPGRTDRPSGPSSKPQSMKEEKKKCKEQLAPGRPFFSEGCDQTPDPHPQRHFISNYEHLCYVSDQS
jgi:hypothetical protein